MGKPAGGDGAVLLFPRSTRRPNSLLLLLRVVVPFEINSSKPASRSGAKPRSKTGGRGRNSEYHPEARRTQKSIIG